MLYLLHCPIPILPLSVLTYICFSITQHVGQTCPFHSQESMAWKSDQSIFNEQWKNQSTGGHRVKWGNSVNVLSSRALTPDWSLSFMATLSAYWPFMTFGNLGISCGSDSQRLCWSLGRERERKINQFVIWWWIKSICLSDLELVFVFVKEQELIDLYTIS